VANYENYEGLYDFNHDQARWHRMGNAALPDSDPSQVAAQSIEQPKRNRKLSAEEIYRFQDIDTKSQLGIPQNTVTKDQ